MKDTVLTLNMVLPVAERIVAGHENFVYPSEGGCHYQLDGKPSCVVGKILSELGWSGEDLKVLDRPEGDHTGVIGEWIENGDIQADYAATQFLSTLQWHQDVSFPWGDALAKAKLQVNRDV